MSTPASLRYTPAYPTTWPESITAIRAQMTSRPNNLSCATSLERIPPMGIVPAQSCSVTETGFLRFQVGKTPSGSVFFGVLLLPVPKNPVS
jgi:hypothetical protein